MELSTCVISIATKIGMLFLPKLKSFGFPLNVEREIKAAWQEAKENSFSPEIRESSSFERKWRRIELELSEKVDSDFKMEDYSRETRAVYNEFSKALAKRTEAYNYLKDIKDMASYNAIYDELIALEKEMQDIKQGVQDVKQGVQDVKQRIGSIDIQPFLDIEMFKRRFSRKAALFSNQKIETIKAALRSPDIKTIRFIALSGMGKTHIVYEAFKETETNLYYCENCEDAKFIRAVKEILFRDPNALLILDNCSLIIFEEVVEIRDDMAEGVKIIGINNDVAEKRSFEGIIKLDNKDFIDIVERCLEDLPNGKENSNYARLVEFSEGIPYMAILLKKAWERQRSVGYVNEDNIFRSLLGIKTLVGEDKRKMQVLESCALFNPLGYSDEYKWQTDFVAANKKITPLDIVNDEVCVKFFRGVCDEYVDRELIEYLSSHINVRPMPLAIWLATQWFKGTTDDDLMEIINAEKNCTNEQEEQHAKALKEAFARRLEFLTESPQAQKILTKLLARNGSFHNEKVLNSSMGSRLLLAFTYVVPEQVTDTLYDLYWSKSIESLEVDVIGDSRRNFVRILEQLCSQEDYFDKAIKVLFKLALAENEHWSNNATGLFLQLFHVFLSGTKAKLNDRLGVIRYCCNHQDTRFVRMGLKAIDSALKCNQFIRVRGSETQESRFDKEFIPSEQEIDEYWVGCIKLLKNVVAERPDYTDEGVRIVENHAMEMVLAGYYDLLFELLDFFGGLKDNDWEGILRILNLILHNDKISIDATNQEHLESFIERFTQDGFLPRMKMLEQNMIHGFKKPQDEQNAYIDSNYKRLAEEFVDKYWNDKSLLEQIYKSELFYTHVFAQHLSSLEEEWPEKVDFFITNSLDILQKHEENTRISMFVYYSMYLQSIGYKEDIISKLFEYRLYPVLFAVVGANYHIFTQENRANYLKKLCELLKEGEVEASTFKNFLNYLSFSLPGNERLEIYKEISSFGLSGKLAIFNELLLSNTIFGNAKNDDFLEFCKQYLRELFDVYIESKERLPYDVIELTEKVMQARDDSEFAVWVNKQLLESLTFEHTDNFSFKRIYALLLDKYKEKIWPDLSRALLADDGQYMQYYELQYIIGSGIGLGRGPLFNYSDEVLLQWCESNQPLAARRLISMAPVYETADDGKSRFSDIVLKILERFGDDQEVLHGLSCNMGSFTWTGPIVAYYEQEKQALEHLIQHTKSCVSEWAIQQIEYINSEIEQERKRDDYSKLIH
ncbi:hypothetical protein [Butyricimonas paravirosa]|uniref:hypothetical protein n=1 Tax=Butyricimonas paravirosa TaxID=1472417 RepID=UPI002A8397B3|nr:hypothetical protein [Butyricimonas paravirosa]